MLELMVDRGFRGKGVPRENFTIFKLKPNFSIEETITRYPVVDKLTTWISPIESGIGINGSTS